MSNDITVEFTRVKSTTVRVQVILQDFFNFQPGEGGILWKGDRWFINLPGESKFALYSVAKHVKMEPAHKERWIEVWPEGPIVALDRIVIITRQQDDFTSSLAEGLAAVFRRFFGNA